MKRWNWLRQELKQGRFKFDAAFRQQNTSHNCKSKVRSWNGEWFCKHLTNARYSQFKAKINEEEGIMFELAKEPISTTKYK